METKVKSSPADFQEWTRTTKRTTKSETTKRRNKEQVSVTNKIEIENTNLGILSLIEQKVGLRKRELEQRVPEPG